MPDQNVNSNFPTAAAPSSLLPPRYDAIGQGTGVLNRGAEAVGRASPPG